MARINFKVDYSGFQKRLRASSKDINSIMKDRRSIDNLLDRLQKRQENRWMRNFNSQGAEYGTKWAAITEATRKGRSNPNNPTLVDSGHARGMLKPFMTDNSYPFGDVGIEWDFTGKGDSEFPLPFHHTGFTNYMTNRWVSPRVIWELDKKDEDNAFRLFSRWAHEEIRKLPILS